jgi:hypothetical protein
MANGNRDHRSPESKARRSARNARSYARARERHAARQNAQTSRELANRLTVGPPPKAGGAPVNTTYTDRSRKATYGLAKRPSKIVRALRRLADPQVQERAAAYRRAS